MIVISEDYPNYLNLIILLRYMNLCMGVLIFKGIIKEVVK